MPRHPAMQIRRRPLQSPHSCSEVVVTDVGGDGVRSLAAVFMRMVTEWVHIELPGRFAFDGLWSLWASGPPWVAEPCARRDLVQHCISSRCGGLVVAARCLRWSVESGSDTQSWCWARGSATAMPGPAGKLLLKNDRCDRGAGELRPPAGRRCHRRQRRVLGTSWRSGVARSSLNASLLGLGQPRWHRGRSSSRGGSTVKDLASMGSSTKTGGPGGTCGSWSGHWVQRTAVAAR